MAEWALVTGGAGFIGSHLVEALTANGQRVRVLDDLSTGLLANLSHIRPAPEFVQGSITDLPTVERAMMGVDVVYHLAALASVARSIETPLVSHQACATGTVVVLDAARRAGVRRVVYAGSSSAYGGHCSDAGQTEDLPLRAMSPYAAAKLAGEFYLQAFAASFGIETVRLRFFNIFGPRQRADSPYSGVIAIFTSKLAAGQSPVVHGDGLQSRDFTYVANAVDCLMRAATVPGISGRVYNVGTGNSITVLELAEALNRLLGTNVPVRFGPARPGDVRYSRADISRTRAELGYTPSVDFDTGLERTLAWYLQTRQVPAMAG